jgi:indole-3-glycerol phosphate synthase
MNSQNYENIEKEIEKKQEIKKKAKKKTMKVSGSSVKKLQEIIRNKKNKPS